ncbi:MAG: hypothetical protein HY922_10950 [Elusimicrobia bacterium]|nr:hypothetical protein [Elusimicrobiota bacterium]
MKTRFAMPVLVVIFSVAALALMSVSVRTTSAQDISTAVVQQDGNIAPSALQSAADAASSTQQDGNVAKPATPTQNFPSTTPTDDGLDKGEDTGESKGGCCGG